MTQEQAAQEANLALAVLSYLKLHGLQDTAQSFTSEWLRVHDRGLLRNESVVMGVIRWEPPEDHPMELATTKGCSTKESWGETNPGTEVQQNAPLVVVPKPANICPVGTSTQSMGKKIETVPSNICTRVTVQQAVVETPRNETKFANPERPLTMEGHGESATRLKTTAELSSNEIPRDSGRTRAVARKGIIRCNSMVCDSGPVSPRRTIRRSVSFDNLENVVVHHVPRYDKSAKKDLFYSKQDVSQMRFDHQREKDQAEMEKQLAATEVMMNMIKLANAQMGVSSQTEE